MGPWSLPENHFSSTVAAGGFLYGFDNATLKCLDAATGEEKWAYRGFGKGSLTAADGRLVILSDRGTLALAEATPEGYREKGKFQVMEGTAWTSPSLARGRLYLRDQDEILALDLRVAGAVNQVPSGSKSQRQAGTIRTVRPAISTESSSRSVTRVARSQEVSRIPSSRARSSR